MSNNFFSNTNRCCVTSWNGRCCEFPLSPTSSSSNQQKTSDARNDGNSLGHNFAIKVTIVFISWGLAGLIISRLNKMKVNETNMIEFCRLGPPTLPLNEVPKRQQKRCQKRKNRIHHVWKVNEKLIFVNQWCPEN